MTFDELRIAVAVVLAKSPDEPWIRDACTESERLDYARKVQGQHMLLSRDCFFPFTVDEVIRVAFNVRKQPDTRIKAEVAMTHGWECFWRNRNKGPCDDTAECGHLVPRCKGGELTIPNCVIECRSHNNQRREMTIEEYLSSELTQ